MYRKAVVAVKRGVRESNHRNRRRARCRGCFLAEIKEHGGVVLHTSLDETREKVLRDALASATAAASEA